MTTTTKEVFTSSPEETIEFGKALAAELSPPALVLLYGELGAGKTTLVKGVAAGFGAAQEEDVTSPTFVLVQEYGDNRRIYHVDLYRIGNTVELESLGLEDLLAEDAIVLVEWPERLSLPAAQLSIRVFLEVAGETERRIRIERPAG